VPSFSVCDITHKLTPVTPYYTLPLDKVYDLLNEALASEIICVLRHA
jgi:hypothetical protein